jgi:hypothetical protein
MSNNKPGKLVFSNPASPDSPFKPVMKKLSDVAAFSAHKAPAGLKTANVAATPQVAVYEAPPDVTVTKDHPLVISGNGPVAVVFGTVTIEPGGQIQVLTTADISIQKLVKN